VGTDGGGHFDGNQPVAATARECDRCVSRRDAPVPTVRITQDPAADELLGRDPLALLLGMLVAHHVRQRRS
jgi:hypothetical protein